MVKIKETYVSPTTETLVVRFEGALLDASPWGAANEPGPGFGEDPSHTFNY